MHGSLRKLGNAVFIIVAGQRLGHPEKSIGSIDHAKAHAQDQRHPRHFRLGQSKTPDSQCFYNAQHAADEVYGQIFLYPLFLAFWWFCLERQRLLNERIHFFLRKLPLLRHPAALQELCHRNAQLLRQR